ncbi:MAG: hypothetical protein ACKVT0_08210 [Planctomycetaceae bacterium]
MMTPSRWVRLARTVSLLALCVTLVSVTPTDANSKSKAKKAKRPITKPKFDPDAEKVELFKGMEEGQLDARIVAKDAFGGKILVQNMTDKPLTVEMPESLVAVHVLKQFGGGMGGMGGGGMGGMGGMGGGGMGGMGGGQSMGGGMGGGMGGMGGGMGGMGGGMGGMGGGGGGGFFSIPAEQIVSLPFKSVCLEHGRPDPTSSMVYIPVPTDRYTDDTRLQALINQIGRGRLDPASAQAAAWHVSSGMSWDELANKQYEQLGGLPSVSYFNQAHLFNAQEIVYAAIEESKEIDEKLKDQEPREGPALREIIREGRRTTKR